MAVGWRGDDVCAGGGVDVVIAQHQPVQVSICFDASPMPEADVNRVGVLVGPGLVREWWPDRNQRAMAALVVRRLGGDYCYAASLSAGSMYNGYATSFKWNRFSDFDQCLNHGMEEVERGIRRIINRNDSDLPVAAMKKLLAAFERGEFIEKTTGVYE